MCGSVFSVLSFLGVWCLCVFVRLDMHVFLSTAPRCTVRLGIHACQCIKSLDVGVSGYTCILIWCFSVDGASGYTWSLGYSMSAPEFSFVFLCA